MRCSPLGLSSAFSGRRSPALPITPVIWTHPEVCELPCPGLLGCHALGWMMPQSFNRPPLSLVNVVPALADGARAQLSPIALSYNQSRCFIWFHFTLTVPRQPCMVNLGATLQLPIPGFILGVLSRPRSPMLQTPPSVPALSRKFPLHSLHHSTSITPKGGFIIPTTAEETGPPAVTIPGSSQI